MSVCRPVCLCLSQIDVLSKQLNESDWFLARELLSIYPTISLSYPVLLVTCLCWYSAGGVTSLEFSVSSRYLAVAGDKHVAVFHNVAGYRSTIAELEHKQKTATSAAMRERLQAQIDEARSVRC